MTDFVAPVDDPRRASGEHYERLATAHLVRGDVLPNWSATKRRASAGCGRGGGEKGGDHRRMSSGDGGGLGGGPRMFHL